MAALRGARRRAGGSLGPSAHDVGRGRGACGAARDTGGSGRARPAERFAARGRRLPARSRWTLLRHDRHGLSAGSARPRPRTPGASQLALARNPDRHVRLRGAACGQCAARARAGGSAARRRGVVPALRTARTYAARHAPARAGGPRVAASTGASRGLVRLPGPAAARARAPPGGRERGLPRRGDRPRPLRARPPRHRHLRLRPAPHGGGHRRPARCGHRLLPWPTTRHRHRTDLHGRRRRACHPGPGRCPEPLRRRAGARRLRGLRWAPRWCSRPPSGSRSSLPT